MKVVYYVDIWLLNKFQKFSTWFQKLTGITCFKMAKFFAKIAIAVLTLDAIFDFLGNHSRILLMVDVICLLWWIVQCWQFVLFCEKLDKKYTKGCNSVNELLISRAGIVCRILLLSFSIFYLGTIVATILLVSFHHALLFDFAVIVACLAAYFASCTPLPPG